MTDLTSHWRSLFENRYLGSWNLFVKGKYVTARVTIERATRESVTMQGGRKSVELLLYFVGKKTPLILTKKMGKVLAMMYGPTPAQWEGKPMTLYVEQGFKTREGPADVLRIKNEKAGAGLKEQLEEQQRNEPPEQFDEETSGNKSGEVGSPPGDIHHAPARGPEEAGTTQREPGED